MRQRLRPKHSDEMLAEIYSKPYDHKKWPDHKLRVKRSIEICNEWCERFFVAADLSCGDGAILNNIRCASKIYGDYSPGYAFHGKIEDTIQLISDVNFFVCSETIEHLDDPDTVLRHLRKKTDMLFLSTPLGCFNDENVEHYWAWDKDAIRDMLIAARFIPVYYEEQNFGIGYTYQFWVCD